MRSMVNLPALHDEVDRRLADAPVGRPLTPVVRAMVEYAVRAAVTTLDLPGARSAAERALDEGATAAQLQEVLTLTSGLGVHTLMEGEPLLADLLDRRGEPLDEPDEDRVRLRERLLGSAPFWDALEREVPGFLDALLRLSPVAFEGFVAYGALPARTHELPSVVRELISVALDALPNHRYLPGLRLHLAQAIRLGAGRAEILEAVAVAAAAPEPPGVG